MNQTIPGQESVGIIDCHFFEPLRVSAYLIQEGQGAAFVDAGTRFALPHFMEALRLRGLGPENVEYIIPTHVHLDHAGGAAALAEACPNAVVLAHPRAVRHLADPSRLVEGVKAVYGADYVDRVYGEIEGIDAVRIRAVADESRLQFGARTLRFLHTRGHANHHICIHDSGSNAVFAGDSFGVGRVGLDRAEEPYVFCAAAPADFDPELARESAKRILGLGASVVYQGHFGPVVNQEEAALQLLSNIGQLEGIMHEARKSGLEGAELADFCALRVREAMLQHHKNHGLDKMQDPLANPAQFLKWFETDIRLNGMGVAMAAERSRRTASETD